MNNRNIIETHVFCSVRTNIVDVSTVKKFYEETAHDLLY